MDIISAISAILGLLGLFQNPRSKPMAQPAPTATPTATPTPDMLAQYIQQGMEKFGAPMATKSAELAEAGRRLDKGVAGEGNMGIPQEYIPAVKSLKESGGLKGSETARRTNNPFGMLQEGEYISYPDLRTAILGGGPNNQKGYVKNILQSPYGAYDDYIQSGDIRDLMKHYTPANDPRNNALNQQISTMQSLYNTYFNQGGVR